MKSKITLYGLLVLVIFSLTNAVQHDTKGLSTVITSKTFDKGFNFIILSDWGWNGGKMQQIVANQMAKTADSIHTKFIVSCGDNFQYSGVTSTLDPLWTMNFENVYRAPSLQVDWFPVLGNHDYKGNTQAEIDYSKISTRWKFTEHYYTFAKKINDSISARFIFLDTPPFIKSYQNNHHGYPDIEKQDTAMELKWLNNVLANAKEKVILVFGHHPVYSASIIHGNTPEMIQKVKPLLEKYRVQFYFCGHDHDFQHLHNIGSKVDYIVSGTGGAPRFSMKNKMSLFSGAEAGFTVVSLKDNTISVSFVNTKGNIIYKYSKSYR
jgi:tartrate-resistant acid phosphatase type 5